MKRSVLFLCTGNSCRSQMAEGFLRHLAWDRFEVASAGTSPVGLNPLAVEVMNEIGVDISHHRSKDISAFDGMAFEYVITVCDRAKESCPFVSGTTATIHWTFEDPAAVQGTKAERLPVFRRVRDEIRVALDLFVQMTADPFRDQDDVS